MRSMLPCTHWHTTDRSAHLRPFCVERLQHDFALAVVLFQVSSQLPIASLGRSALAGVTNIATHRKHTNERLHAHDMHISPCDHAISSLLCSVQGMDQQAPYTFNIVNMHKKTSLFQRGMRPLAFSCMATQKSTSVPQGFRRHTPYFASDVNEWSGGDVLANASTRVGKA